MRRIVPVLCGISSEAEGRAAKQALAGYVLAAVLSGCASLDGGSRRQNIATVIQTAYDVI